MIDLRFCSLVSIGGLFRTTIQLMMRLMTYALLVLPITKQLYHLLYYKIEPLSRYMHRDLFMTSAEEKRKIKQGIIGSMDAIKY